MIGRCSSMKGSREDTVRTSMCSYEWPKFHAFVSGWVIFHLIGQVQGKPWNSQCVTNVNPRSWLPHLLLLLGHSVVSDYLVTLWTVASSSIHETFQARILKWLPFPSPGDLLDPGTEPLSPALQAILYRWASREATPVSGLLIFRF